MKLKKKIELYKHNELFNIYYGIFYELWTFAYFDRLCKLEKRGDEIKKISSPLKLLSQSQPNFAEIILGWSPFKIVSVSAVLYPKWSPLLKKISSNGQNCSILSVLSKLEKRGDEISTWNNPGQNLCLSAVLYPKWSPLK